MKTLPLSRDGKPICVNCNEVGHDQTKCPKPRVEPKDRKCLRCDKTGHVASQCKSNLPLKELGADDGEPSDDYTLSLEGENVEVPVHVPATAAPSPHLGEVAQDKDGIRPERRDWTVVECGNKRPHVHLAATSFEHQTSFQVFDVDSEGDEGNDVGEPEEEEAWYPEDPCCSLDCQARGLYCTKAMLEEMKRQSRQRYESEPHS